MEQPTTIILPNYIQKNIIKILLHNINRVNRDEYKISIGIDNKKEETGFIDDLKSLSLVNKLYFNVVSNNLTVSVDFISFRDTTKDYFNSRYFFTSQPPDQSIIDENNHYIVKRLKQQQQQSLITNNYNIIKYENIKELVLNIEYWDIKIVDNSILSLINEAIKTRYINLEKVILKCPLELIKFIDFPNIRISTCIIIYPNQQNISHIKRVEADNLKLYLNSTDNYLYIFKSFNQINSLFSENWVDFKYLYENLTNENGNGINCFTNTLKIMMNKITIESWCYLLKLVPIIQYINIQICIDNLMYQLNEENQINIVSCQCSSNLQNDQTNFNQNWQYIVNTIKDHKYLKSLFISHNCDFSSISLSREQRFTPNLKNGSFSQPLLNQFKLMLSNTLLNQFDVPGFNSKNLN